MTNGTGKRGRVFGQRLLMSVSAVALIAGLGIATEANAMGPSPEDSEKCLTGASLVTASKDFKTDPAGGHAHSIDQKIPKLFGGWKIINRDDLIVSPKTDHAHDFTLDNYAVGIEEDFSGASATGGNAFACGQKAVADGENATAIGAKAEAIGDGNTAVGAQAEAKEGSGATAVGSQAEAKADNATAIGEKAEAKGTDSTAVGQGAEAKGNESSAFGKGAEADFDGTAIGAHAEATANDTTAVGNEAKATKTDATAVGEEAEALGTDSTAIGENSLAKEDDATAIGQDARAEGVDSTSIGQGSRALAVGSSAFGEDSRAEGAYSTTLGSETRAEKAGSVALGTDSTGQGAVASLENQFVLGTANHTYTAPGITSDLSRSRQSGPLEVVTTDANGNLASDGGVTFEQIATNTQGVAMAIAMENPDLVGGESFGIAAHWGHFNEANAIGIAAMGVLTRDLFEDGSGARLAISGSVGFSLDDEDLFGQEADNEVAFRAGGQITW